jgi:O-6-methylguanine DNA methyltransferase
VSHSPAMDGPKAPGPGPVPFGVSPGPWGPVHVAVRSGALVALELMTPSEVFVPALERRLRAPVVPLAEAGGADREVVEIARAQLEEYLDGRRRAFELPIDLVGVSAWDRAVLAGVAGIPYGRVTSYGRLARLIGRPGAARATGGAVGRNPIGIVIPCHRVIAGDGSLGGYGGDWFGSRRELLAIKRGLLEREGVSLPATEFVGG